MEAFILLEFYEEAAIIAAKRSDTKALERIMLACPNKAEEIALAIQNEQGAAGAGGIGASSAARCAQQ